MAVTLTSSQNFLMCLQHVIRVCNRPVECVYTIVVGFGQSGENQRRYMFVVPAMKANIRDPFEPWNLRLPSRARRGVSTASCSMQEGTYKEDRS